MYMYVHNNMYVQCVTVFRNKILTSVQGTPLPPKPTSSNSGHCFGPLDIRYLKILL